MATKSSQNRKPVSPRVPKKWRNLPPAGHGITPAMKARPIIERTPNEEIEGRMFDDVCMLMPVPLTAWIEEHAEMLLRGYHIHQTDCWMIPCFNCHSEECAFLSFTKRHRNGKPNFDTGRDFILCPQCLHVTEEIYIINETGEIFQQGERHLDTGDSDAA